MTPLEVAWAYISKLDAARHDAALVDQFIVEIGRDPLAPAQTRRALTAQAQRFRAQLRRQESQVRPALRRLIRDRDQDVCRYCGDEELGRWLGDYAIDHVVPVSAGGLTAADNLVVACVPCNSRKRARTPEQAGMTLRPLADIVRKRPRGMRLWAREGRRGYQTPRR